MWNGGKKEILEKRTSLRKEKNKYSEKLKKQREDGIEENNRYSKIND